MGLRFVTIYSIGLVLLTGCDDSNDINSITSSIFEPAIEYEFEWFVGATACHGSGDSRDTENEIRPSYRMSLPLKLRSDLDYPVTLEFSSLFETALVGILEITQESVIERPSVSIQRTISEEAIRFEADFVVDLNLAEIAETVPLFVTLPGRPVMTASTLNIVRDESWALASLAVFPGAGHLRHRDLDPGTRIAEALEQACEAVEGGETP